MDLVSQDDVGPASLDRMVREGVLSPLGPGYAAPLDLPVTPVDRARPLVGLVPPHTVLSGLAGLWVLAGGTRPTTLDLVGLRGLHRAPPGSHPPGWILRFHSGAAALEPAGSVLGIRVASPARCVVDALRWADLGRAIPMILSALRTGTVTPEEVAGTVGRESPRGRGSARAASAWGVIDKALRSA